MNIKMYKSKVDNTFIFKVYRAKKPILLGKSYPSKQACLSGIEQALSAIRSNNMINIRSKEGGGGFLFSTGNVESCVFKTLDQASDGLAFLKETIGKKQDFNVAFDTVKEQVISKKVLGRPSEGYDFKQVSKTEKPGFELLDKDSGDFYFHFNDKEGKPIFFSRSYDGKTVRTKAARNLITCIKEETLVTEILAAGNSSVFLLKTAAQEEIGRSKRFKSKAAAIESLKDFKKVALGKVKILKLAKKKKKKKKKKLPNQKYDLKQVAPIGNIGFEAFRSQKNKFDYFQFFDKTAKPLLHSRAFDSRGKRDAAMMEAIELSGDKRLYAITEKEGNYHFVLQNTQGKGIAKSRIFANKAALIEGMRYFHANAKSYADLSNVLMIPSSEQITININKKKSPPVPKKRGAKSKSVTTKPIAPIAVKPSAAKEIPPIKTESKTQIPPKSRKETPKKTPPKQQQQQQQQQQQGNNTNRRKNTSPVKPIPTADTKQPLKQAGNKQPNNQSNNQKTPPKAKQPRSTPSNNRNNNNNRNRNQPPLKEGQSPKQASTRTNYVDPVVSKKSTNKDAPPRILPRGETEIPKLGFWKWLIPLILAIIVGIWLLRSCVGVTKEAVSAKPIIEKVVEPVVEKLPTLLGVNAADLGFEKRMVAAKIADFLSLPGSVFPATFVLDKVHFPTNQDRLDQEAYAQLDRMGLILKAYPDAVVQIKGHTDNVGGTERNVELSEERASIVLNYLLGKGLKSNRISAKGFGEMEPIQTNDTAEGRSANRRSEIVLIKR